MRDYFVDLHVHIGSTSKGNKVKYASADNLTFENIAEECILKKGIDVVGIVDCASPRVIEDIKELINEGLAKELDGGGLLYKDRLCIIYGSEIETTEIGDAGACEGHTINFFPTLQNIVSFSNTMSKHIKNINLSSQRANISSKELLHVVESNNGILIPAHVFSPHKGLYGNCVHSLKVLFGEDFKKIHAVELGLSADTIMADQLSELENITFISNSDAHSLPKIAREYNIMTLESDDFTEILKAIKNEDGRKIKANYGLNPKLGKYHRTFCEKCDEKTLDSDTSLLCRKCGGKVTMGVFDRIETIKDKQISSSPPNRPPYIHQIPLEYIPGLGKRTIDKLISFFGSEMDILHFASKEDLEKVVKKEIAENIIKGREGNLHIEEGGGGIYGSIK